MRNIERGITLIALVVTIIVLLIIAGVGISGIINGDILNNTKKVAFQNDLRAFQEKIDLYAIKKEELTGEKFKTETLNADKDSLEYDSILQENENIYDIIPEEDIEDKYKEKISIENGKIVIMTSDEKEKEWAAEIGISTKEI